MGRPRRNDRRRPRRGYHLRRGGDDTIYGEDGSDVLVGCEGLDCLSGADGDDVLFSGRLYDGGSDTLIGGAARETFVLGDFGTDRTPARFDRDTLALDLAT